MRVFIGGGGKEGQKSELEKIFQKLSKGDGRKWINIREKITTEKRKFKKEAVTWWNIATLLSWGEFRENTSDWLEKQLLEFILEESFL